jgi:hypothetical protein
MEGIMSALFRLVFAILFLSLSLALPSQARALGWYLCQYQDDAPETAFCNSKSVDECSSYSNCAILNRSTGTGTIISSCVSKFEYACRVVFHQLYERDGNVVCDIPSSAPIPAVGDGNNCTLPRLTNCYHSEVDAVGGGNDCPPIPLSRAPDFDSVVYEWRGHGLLADKFIGGTDINGKANDIINSVYVYNSAFLIRSPSVNSVQLADTGCCTFSDIPSGHIDDLRATILNRVYNNWLQFNIGVFPAGFTVSLTANQTLSASWVTDGILYGFRPSATIQLRKGIGLAGYSTVSCTDPNLNNAGRLSHPSGDDFQGAGFVCTNIGDGTCRRMEVDLDAPPDNLLDRGSIGCDGTANP